MDSKNAVVIVAGIAILGVIGFAIYASNQASVASATAGISGYDAGYARGSKRTEAEKVGGAIGVLGSEAVKLVGGLKTILT